MKGSKKGPKKPQAIQLSLHGHLCKISKYNRLKFRHIEDHTDTADKLNLNAKAMLGVAHDMNFVCANTKGSKTKYLHYIEDTYGVGMADAVNTANAANAANVPDKKETFHLSFDSAGFLVQLPHGMKVVTNDISACIGLDCIITIKMTKYEFKSKLESNLGELITGVNLTLVNIRVGTV